MLWGRQQPYGHPLPHEFDSNHAVNQFLYQWFSWTYAWLAATLRPESNAAWFAPV